MSFDQSRFDIDGFDGPSVDIELGASLYGVGDIDIARGHRRRQILNINCYGEGEIYGRISRIINGNVSLTGVGDLVSEYIRGRRVLAGIDGDGEIYAGAFVGIQTTFQYNNILSPGETLVLDCQKFTAKKNGINAISSISGDFPILYPGNNVVVYSDDDETRAANLKIRYRNRYV